MQSYTLNCDWFTPGREIEEYPLKLIQKTILDQKLKGIRRGDLIRLEPFGTYRNSGVMMWDGERPVHLDYSFYEYGCIPRIFTLSEFHPEYFEKVHSTIAWLPRGGKLKKTARGGYFYFHLGQKYQLWSDMDNENIVKTFKRFASMDSPIPVDLAFDELCEDPKSVRKIFPEGRIYVLYEAWVNPEPDE